MLLLLFGQGFALFPGQRAVVYRIAVHHFSTWALRPLFSTLSNNLLEPPAHAPPRSWDFGQGGIGGSRPSAWLTTQLLGRDLSVSEPRLQHTPAGSLPFPGWRLFERAMRLRERFSHLALQLTPGGCCIVLHLERYAHMHKRGFSVPASQPLSDFPAPIDVEPGQFRGLVLRTAIDALRSHTSARS